MTEDPSLEYPKKMTDDLKRRCTRASTIDDPDCSSHEKNRRRNARRVTTARQRQVPVNLANEPLQQQQQQVIDLSTLQAIARHGFSGLTSSSSSLHSFQKKKKKTKQNKVTFHLSSTKVRLPTDEQWSHPEDPFVTPSVNDPDMDGALVPLKRQKHAVIVNDDDEEEDDDDPFADSINWATTENPDGVAIVHEAMDQGSCGSCWALAATGSLEANAARREAAAAFAEYSRVNATYARRYAQAVERQSLERLNLSIQELIDCDTDMDLGCTGGNPLLAFDFMHRYGLVHAATYPYTGSESSCRKKAAHTPVATVSSWGILPPNSERHMELALRYIGPIAVGFNGAEPSFLSYRGGIFRQPHCDHAANHALLVVGYGQVVVADDGDENVTVPYWIARNSWGPDWGEHGLVRIQREKGGHGRAGQCGIAKSPSVALGGVLLDRVFQSIDQNRPDDDAEELLEPVAPYTLLEQWCVRAGLSLETTVCGQWAHWSATHKALCFGILGLVATLLGVVWPLTWECRRRADRRRRRKLMLRSTSHGEGEGDPLLRLENGNENYGGTATTIEEEGVDDRSSDDAPCAT